MSGLGLRLKGVTVTVEFRLLGEIEVCADGRALRIGGARQQGVLAALLVEANRAVPAEQLMDRVWGTHRLPNRPANALQTYISLLRRALATVAGVAIERQSAGYRLTVDEATVDQHLFRRLVHHARVTPDADRAAALFQQALELWRGEAFAVLDTPWFTAIRATLDRERHAARLDLTDIQLRRGQHTALLAGLLELAEDHPLDERLASQLMLALYRSGLQARALRHYQRLRERLAEELGADPGPPLQQLHQRILAADRTLADPGTTTTSTTGSPRAPVPRQLPAAPRLFTGRTRELAALTESLATAQAAPVVISAIGGTGGIGKTWLALHWAYEHLDRFPDGQLYVNLRGFDQTGEPMSPVIAVRSFLGALCVDDAAVPGDPQAQVGLYRSLVADKRLLIVLDNAADTNQVTSLLPGTPTCMVLVTSRRKLTGLLTAHGARSVDLDVLTGAEARELLARHLGRDRVAAEPQAAADLLTCCSGLPLAISIVAARAAGHPDFPLSALADELRDHTGRLDALDGGDLTTNLRAVLSWSYDALKPGPATVFGLLGLAQGPDIGLPAAASLTALTVGRARSVLRDLEHAHLVSQHTPGRYRMHDLVRLYASDHAHDQPRDHREAALRRLVDHYLHTAFTANQLLGPLYSPVELDPPVQGCRPQPPADQTAALAWFDAERPCLLAAQELAVDEGWWRAVWQLAWILDLFHDRRGHFHDALAAWQHGTAAAHQLGDSTTRSVAHRFIGYAYAQLGRHAEALDHLHQARIVAEDARNTTEQAHTHWAIAWTWNRRGDVQQALDHATHALSLFQSIGNPVWEAVGLNGVGWFHALLGQLTQARVHCEASLVLYRRHHEREGEAAALDSLGYVAHHSGHHIEALDHYQQALALFRDVGHTNLEADTLDRIGHTHAALDRHTHARDSWQQAMTLYQAQHRADDADRVRHQLDNLTTPDHQITLANGVSEGV